VAAIDDVLPRYDVHEVHSMALACDPERAVEVALAMPIGSDPIVRALLRLRGLRAHGTIEEAFRRAGFQELVRREGEVVVGASGAPWRRRPRIGAFDDAGPGTVRMATSFHADGSRLTTETRVAAVDEAARRAFARYWRLVGPFSALIRRRWLARIAREAR
jgi:hypothetical protein